MFSGAVFTAPVPAPDKRVEEVMNTMKLEKKDIAMLWKRFSQYDKDKSGTIDVEEFYRMIHEKKNVFADSIFDLIDMDSTEGTMDFGEFVQAVATYSVFGTNDILKFCFFIFDKDKNGFIEMDELQALVDILHDSEKNSNVKVALDMIDRNGDGKVDFDEFQSMHRDFPQLLYPAFRVQESMMEYTLGGKFWKDLRASREEARQKERALSEESRRREERRKQRIRASNVKKKMGFFSYYFCFLRRGPYFEAILAEEKEAREKEAAKKQRLKRAKEAKETAKEAAEKKKALEKERAEEPEAPPTRSERRDRADERRSRRKGR